EVRIVEWLVKEGDKVRKGDPILEIETDKATFEVQAPATGILRQITRQAGEEVPVLEVIALIAKEGEEVPAPQPGDGRQAPPQPIVPEPTALVPGAPETIAVPTQRRVFASPRARKRAREAGLTDLSGIVGTGPGGRIVERDVEAFLAEREKLAAPVAVAVSPVAQRMAQEAGLDLSGVVGTGPGGRITKTDVERALAERAVAKPEVVPAPAPAPEAAPPAPALAAAPGVRRVVPMRGIRARIAERMAESAHTAAHVTLFTEVDATELVALRQRLRDDEVQVSYNDLMVVVVSKALEEHPDLNATLVGDEIHWLEPIHVAVAVDTERGLLVPVIRDANRKRLRQIAAEFAELRQAAQEGRSRLEDLSGGTFTITNLGMFEIDGFTPIINPPQCAVLGIGRIVEKPVIREGEVQIRQMMVLSLSFDHRLVDGAPAARFLQTVKRLVERPHLLLA
ncbi:MAG TPA: biotin/lipoyl-binding protein, partial [Anaerolineae bacterium]|nr:biotin/lipoyl-binding protein [Anaerolineae bacterium]